MRKKGIVFGFLLSLFAGIILGASGGILLFPMIFPPHHHHYEPNDEDKAGGRPPLPPDVIRKRIMERLESELNLTGGQKTQVEKEVNIFADELGIFHDANREKLMSMFETFKTKLAGLLSEEQVVRLDKISRRICNPASPQEPRIKNGADDRRPPPQENNQPGKPEHRPPSF